MKKHEHILIWLGLLVIAVYLLLRVTLGEIVWNPGKFLFSSSGDGLRGYTALAWHVIHGNGSWHEMFHYPEGNHLLYVDVIPVLAGVLHMLTGWGINFSMEDIVMILNIFMLASFFPAAFLLFFIAKHFTLPSWYAAICALTFTFLSPQIDRLTGHFGLVQLWVIPFLWYSLLRWEKSHFQLQWLIAYLIGATLATWIHPYYGLISGGFLSAYTFAMVSGSQIYKGLSLYRRFIPIVLAILPGLIISIWQNITHSGPDDFVISPFGMSHYIGGFESIFLPTYGPIRQAWDYLPNIRHYGLEGYSYVGVAGLAILLCVTWLIIEGHIKKMPAFRRSIAVIWSPSLLASILLLIPAFGIPIKWIPSLQDYLGPLQQFRSLGRLAWIFYSVFTMFSAWTLYQFIIRKWNINLSVAGSWALMIACFVLWAWEASIMLGIKRTEIIQQATFAYPEWTIDWPAELLSNNHTSKDFQAILAIPFFHNGSEKFSHSNWISERYSEVVSVRLGIPSIENYTARAPISTSRKALQLVSHPIIAREWQDQLTDPRPILVFRHKESRLSEGEAWLWSQCDSIGQIADVAWGSITPAHIEADTTKLARLRLLAESASNNTTVTSISRGNPPIWLGFGDRPEAPPGVEARTCTRWDQILWEGDLPSNDAVAPWEISVWIRMDELDNYLPRLLIKQFSEGKEVILQHIPTLQTRDVWGEWAIARDTLTMPLGHFSISAKSNNTTFDRLMIRPLDQDVLGYADGHLILWNNYPLEPNP